MATAIATAKTLIQYDSNLDTAFTNANIASEFELVNILGKEDYNRYKNGLTASDTGFSITAFAEADLSTDANPLTTATSSAGIKYLRENDNVLIAGTTSYNGYYEALNYDRYDNQFDIRVKFVADDGTGTFNIKELNTFTQCHAWLIIYELTFITQEIVLNKVLLTSEEFGDGQLNSYDQGQLNMFRAKIKQRAKSYSKSSGNIQALVI